MIGMDLGLYDSATMASLKAIKSVSLVGTKTGENVQLLFTQSRRGRIVQVRSGVMRTHYHFDKEYGKKMMEEDATRFGFQPGHLYAAVKSSAPPVTDLDAPEMDDGGFTQYRRKQIAELRPWRDGEDMIGISVSAVDQVNGSPKEGDMIARNPANHKDQWLVAAQYFADNFEPIDG